MIFANTKKTHQMGVWNGIFIGTDKGKQHVWSCVPSLNSQSGFCVAQLQKFACASLRITGSHCPSSGPLTT